MSHIENPSIFEDAKIKAWRFFLNHIMMKGGQSIINHIMQKEGQRTLHDLSQEIGKKGFEPDMKEAIGCEKFAKEEVPNYQKRLAEFLAQDFEKETVDFFEKILNECGPVLEIKSLQGHRTLGPLEYIWLSGRYRSDLAEFLRIHTEKFVVEGDRVWLRNMPKSVLDLDKNGIPLNGVRAKKKAVQFLEEELKHQDEVPIEALFQSFCGPFLRGVHREIAANAKEFNGFLKTNHTIFHVHSNMVSLVRNIPDQVQVGQGNDSPSIVDSRKDKITQSESVTISNTSVKSQKTTQVMAACSSSASNSGVEVPLFPGHLFGLKEIQDVLMGCHIVVIGDSVQRGVYKDLVLALQHTRLLKNDHTELKGKGELSFLNDELVYRTEKTNGLEFIETREYQTDDHLVQYYYVTRCYNDRMEVILNSFLAEPPDIVIMNSALWDMSRYNLKTCEKDYPADMAKLMSRMRDVLKPEALFIWTTTLPVASKMIPTGFLTEELQFLSEELRVAVLEYNYMIAQIVAKYGFNVLDLHYYLRCQLDHREPDGVHWDPIAHRHITDLLLAFISQSWGEKLPYPVVERMKNSCSTLEDLNLTHFIPGHPDFAITMSERMEKWKQLANSIGPMPSKKKKDKEAAAKAAESNINSAELNENAAESIQNLAETNEIAAELIQNSAKTNGIAAESNQNSAETNQYAAESNQNSAKNRRTVYII